MKEDKQYLAAIEVVRPIVAGLSKEYFDFRIFRRGKEQIVVYKYDFEKNKELIEKLKKEYPKLASKEITDYKSLKKALQDIGFVDLDYIFPRVAFDPLTIDWYKYFVRPIYFMLTKDGGYRNVKIYDIRPSELSVGVYHTYVGTTKAPVIYETVDPGSKIVVVFGADGEGKSEIKGYIGRMKKLGFGFVKATVQSLSKRK